MAQAEEKIAFVKSKDDLGPRIKYNIESVSRIGDAFLINGWMVDPDEQCRSILVRKLAGKRVAVAQLTWVRFARKDVADAFPGLAKPGDLHGFAFVTTEFPDPDDATKLNINLLTKSGKAFGEFIDVREVNSFDEAITQGFGTIIAPPVNLEICKKLFAAIVEGALPLRKAATLLSLNQFGSPVSNPELSIIIPIYGNLDLMQYQIGNLINYASPTTEIVFAVDDPNLVNGALRLGQRLSGLLNLSFKVVAPTRNLGFSGINNFASQYCESRNILFLNSDCFPVQGGWEEKVVKALDEKKYAIIGARLLFMDETIQHDGIEFESKIDLPGFVLNAHPNKSLPAKIIKPNSTKEKSTCVTAAFMAIRKEVFDELGHFDEGYIRGDFEDTDLCLKAIDAGYKIGIIRDQKIFHLERLSQKNGIDNFLRNKITLTNSARQSTKWEALLSTKLPLIENI